MRKSNSRNALQSPSRRDFLRNSAAGAAAASLFYSTFTIAAEGAKGANERIGVGFIGTGGRCGAHIGIVNDFKKQGIAEPVAVCDVYRPRLEAAAKATGGAKMYMEHEALLADPNVDVVCIASPDRLHAPQAIDALNAGKDVYCEKPLTHWSQFELAKKVARGRRPQQAARAGRHAAHGRRQLPGDHQADPGRDHRQADARHVQLLPPRRLGRADAHSRRQRQARPRPASGSGSWATRRRSISRVSRFFQWRMYWDYAGGPATDLLVHTFTPIFCILELDYPERVFGGGGTFQYNREVPDQCNIIADYPGGPSVVMTNSLSNHVPADTIIRGTDGLITWAHAPGRQGVRRAHRALRAKGKKEILLPWKGQGDTSKLWANLLDCVKTPPAAEVQHRHGRPRAGAALDGHPLAPREQGRQVRPAEADDRDVVGRAIGAKSPGPPQGGGPVFYHPLTGSKGKQR